VDKTKEILVQVQDLGRRMAGINVELPVSYAIVELSYCLAVLTALRAALRRERTALRRAEVEDDSTDGDTE
jgi:hypothetical protein